MSPQPFLTVLVDDDKTFSVCQHLGADIASLLRASEALNQYVMSITVAPTPEADVQLPEVDAEAMAKQYAAGEVLAPPEEED